MRLDNERTPWRSKSLPTKIVDAACIAAMALIAVAACLAVGFGALP